MDFIEIPETSKVFHNSTLEQDESGDYRVRFVRDLGGSRVPEKYQALSRTTDGWDLLGLSHNKEGAILMCVEHQLETAQILELMKK